MSKYQNILLNDVQTLRNKYYEILAGLTADAPPVEVLELMPTLGDINTIVKAVRENCVGNSIGSGVEDKLVAIFEHYLSLHEADALYNLVIDNQKSPEDCINFIKYLNNDLNSEEFAKSNIYN